MKKRRFLGLVIALSMLMLSGLKALAQQTTANALANFKPAIVGQYFKKVTTIPHCSGKEGNIVAYIKSVADEHHLFVNVDEFNNLLVRIPATAGLQNEPWKCLQAHIDMVCQTTGGSTTNMFPLQLYVKGDLLKARNSTLGADDGIGVASLLALMADSSTPHGPLELLFTSGEEGGFTGAEKFKYAVLKSKTFINVDSEEEGILTLGSAGGARMKILLPAHYEILGSKESLYTIIIDGLQGGHSGVDINKGRINAVKLASYFLTFCHNLHLVNLATDSVINTIPRKVQFTVVDDAEGSDAGDIQKELQEVLAMYKKKYNVVESPAITIYVQPYFKDMKICSTETQNKLLTLINELPNGVIRMEDGSKTSVRTSNNVAIVQLTADSIRVMMLARSSSEKDLDLLQSTTTQQCNALGAKFILLGRYGGWEPKFHTPFADKITTTYKRLFGQEMITQTVHAGLECAVISQNVPGATIASIGPTVTDAHTPDEALNTPSVERYWKLLTELIK